MQPRSRLLKFLFTKTECYPSLYFPLYRTFEKNRHFLVNSDTEIVIEGFPRSANTFAVIAFEQAQGYPVRIAHHLHVAAQVIEGVRRKLPILVLIREPLDAISSLKIMYPDLDEDHGLKRYIRFYEIVLDNIESVVIGQFDEIISDYGSVIRRINLKFGTDFNIYKPGPENNSKVFDEINRITEKSEFNNMQSLALPTEEKDRMKGELALQFSDNLLRKAMGIYKSIYSQAAGHSRVKINK